jgi:tripeptide aminopeptidase
MGKSDIDFDRRSAIARLMDFLAIEGITGEEQVIGRAVSQELVSLGVPAKALHFDTANERIPLPTQTGNLIVRLPGTVPGPQRLFMTHLDTVPLCAGAKPVRKGKRIVPAGKTALGGDNRTGVACLTTMIATLLKGKLPYPPTTILYTVREESGLWGARYVDLKDLGNPTEAFNVDGGSASELTVGAVGAERWQVEVFGKAAHAGVHPERGVSATMVASLALASVHRDGWFGKVRRDGQHGTSNIGSFGGEDGKSAGNATNVVTDYALIRGEARSHDIRFAHIITSAYRAAFQEAAGQVRNHTGRGARVRFQIRRDYYPFRLKPTAPVVRRAQAAAASIGLSPALRISNGGLDANWLVRHGIPTVTFGAGQNNPHTVDEFVDLQEFEKGCRLALALATTELIRNDILDRPRR